MIEIEKRALLSKKEATRIFDFLEEHASLNKQFNRFTLVYVNRADWVPDTEFPTDIKLRSDGATSTLSLKKDLDTEGHIRDEFEHKFSSSDFPKMLNMLILLGYERYVAAITERKSFKYKELLITVDYHKTVDKYLLEAEVVVQSETEKSKALEIIDAFFDELQLEILSVNDTFQLLQTINNVKAYQFDFKEVNFQDWVTKYKNLFEPANN